MITLMTCGTLLFAFFYAFNFLTLYTKGRRTHAKLIGYEERIGNDRNERAWHPILKFKDEHGKTVVHTVSSGASWKNYELNDEVPILYEPQHPQNLIIAKIDWKVMVLMLFAVGMMVYAAKNLPPSVF